MLSHWHVSKCMTLVSYKNVSAHNIQPTNVYVKFFRDCICEGFKEDARRVRGRNIPRSTWRAEVTCIDEIPLIYSEMPVLNTINVYSELHWKVTKLMLTILHNHMIRYTKTALFSHVLWFY